MMIAGIAHFGSPSQSTGGMPTAPRAASSKPKRGWYRYFQTIATATSVVTNGAKYAVRKNVGHFVSREFTSSAAASATNTDRGAPTKAKYSVFLSAVQNSGVCTRV